MKAKKLLFILALCTLFCSVGLTAQAGFSVGTIVKSPNNPALYIMVPVGKAAHIPSVRVLNCLKLANRTPVTIADGELRRIPKSPLLLQSPAGAIYMVKGERKQHIASPAAFQRLNLDPVSVLPMLDDQLFCIQDGPPIR